MRRVFDRWEVHADQEDAFARAWSQGRRTIRATCKGAPGRVLLRSQREPSECMSLAQWASLTDGQTLEGRAHPASAACRIVTATWTLRSRAIDLAALWTSRPISSVLDWCMADLREGSYCGMRRYWCVGSAPAVITTGRRPSGSRDGSVTRIDKGDLDENTRGRVD